MTLTPVVLAELGSIGKTVVTVLAVAGGFFFGFILSGVLAGFLGKFVFKSRGNPRAVQFTKVGGGGLGAIAIYLLLSGDGGLGIGGRGGNNSVSREKGQANVEKKKENPVKEPTPVQPLERSGTVEVHVLAAASPDGRFFRFADEPSPLTEAELFKRINEYDASADPKPHYIKITKGDPDFSATQTARVYTALVDAFGDRGIEVIPLTDQKDAD